MSENPQETPGDEKIYNAENEIPVDSGDFLLNQGHYEQLVNAGFGWAVAKTHKILEPGEIKPYEVGVIHAPTVIGLDQFNTGENMLAAQRGILDAMSQQLSQGQTRGLIQYSEILKRPIDKNRFNRTLNIETTRASAANTVINAIGETNDSELKRLMGEIADSANKLSGLKPM